MELLRLLSMFLVLVIHANTAFDPWPINENAVLSSPGLCFIRFLIESLSVVCVNSFILLSGWFSIHFSFKKLFSFIFQVLFFSLILVLLPSSRGDLSQHLIDIFTLNQYWFVKAYIILLILSPALNMFAEQASKKVFLGVLTAFFIMQTVFGYISDSVWFDDGFSPLPFIGLYLLARYLRIHQPAFSSFDKRTDLSIYLLTALLIAVLSIILWRWFGTGGRLFNYTNPLVIAASVFFVLFFTKIQIKNSRFINWIAVSSIGAYLLHMNPLFFGPYYINVLQSFARQGNLLFASGLTAVFIILVFLAGVLLDKIRGFLWTSAGKFIDRIFLHSRLSPRGKSAR